MWRGLATGIQWWKFIPPQFGGIVPLKRTGKVKFRHWSFINDNDKKPT